MEKRKAYAYYEERSGRELQVEMGKRLNFPSHLHGELELFLVQSGCVCVGIDGEFRELKAGELAVVFPNTVHSYQCREADSRYMMAVCGTSLLGDYFPSLTQCRPRRPYLCGKALDPDVLYALHSLYRCRCTGADSSISRALLHLILAHVLPELSLEPAPEPKAAWCAISCGTSVSRSHWSTLQRSWASANITCRTCSPRGCTPASGNM